MSYTRVIPRDLFNEAKLLKCLGQLALTIHDGVRIPRSLKIEHDESDDAGFRIEQDEGTGALYCSNLECTCNGRLIGLRCHYNSKDAYPLWFILDEEEDRVFNEDGTLSVEFRKLLESLTA